MMKLSLLGIATIAVFTAGAAYAQSPAPAAAPAASLTFDVASIRPAAPLNAAAFAAGKIHIGMSIDADRVDIGYLSLADLIRIAYRVKPYQVAGPDWMASERFDILAKMPAGATREQVPDMLQALLADRFKLTVHRDTKEHAVYALVVGKGGPKLKESPPDEPVPATDADTSGAKGSDGAGKGTAAGGITIGAGSNQMKVNTSRDGKGVVVSGGQAGNMHMAMSPDGKMRMEASKMTLEAFADMISRFVDRPVVDMTELKGNYQVALELSMDDLKRIAQTAGIMAPGMASGGDSSRPPGDAASDPSGNSIFTVVQQLGLKLDPRKTPVVTIVVDHLEKTPTEN